MDFPPRSAHEAAYAKGKVDAYSFGNEADLSVLSYTYPLKLLSPKLRSTGSLSTAVAYILTYGGGLVSGDSIDLEVNVNANTALVFLTQGSTKIFKVRPKLNDSLDAHNSPPITHQKMHVTVQDGGIILLLVDPVTCFREASYIQHQAFHLSSTASLVVLDWITAGRVSRGEDWDFSRYQSINEVFVDGRRHIRDALCLEATQDHTTPSSLPHRTLRDRLAPYRCYATVFLFGPLVVDLAQNLVAKQAQISQLQLKKPPDFLWSISPVESGWVIRAAAVETETVREWLRETLSSLSVIIGSQVYSKAFV